MRRLSVLTWRRRVAAASILACAAALAFNVAGALADAGNPIQGTIKANAVDNGNGTVTIYVRGQWNWLSHGSDCNFDRAATGVGIIWNDFNGAPKVNNQYQRGTNEKQRIALSGTLANAHFTITWKDLGGTNRTSAVINSSDSASSVDSKLEAIDMGPGNVNVTTGAEQRLGRRVRRRTRADERQPDDGGQQDGRPDGHDQHDPDVHLPGDERIPRRERGDPGLRRLQDTDYSGRRHGSDGAPGRSRQPARELPDRRDRLPGEPDVRRPEPAEHRRHGHVEGRLRTPPADGDRFAEDAARDGCGLRREHRTVSVRPLRAPTCALVEPWGSWGYEKCSTTTGTGPVQRLRVRRASSTAIRIRT